MTLELTGTGIWNSALRFRDEREAQQAAATAEDLGYTALWFGDIGGDDLFPRLDALLKATSQIVIGTGILNVWMHDADEVASKYVEFTEKYGDRLLLGVGVSHGPVVELFGGGQTYADPIAKMTAFLDDLETTEAVPVDRTLLGALGSKMMELARERTHGATPYLVTPRHTAAARMILGPDKWLAPEQGVVLESDPEVARRDARAGLTPYFGLPNYLNSWHREGFSDEEVIAPGSDRLIDALVAWGDESAIAAHLGAHRDAGANHVCIQVFTGEVEVHLAPFPIEQWRRLAPLVNN